LLEDFSDEKIDDGNPVSWTPIHNQSAKHGAQNMDYHLEATGNEAGAYIEGSGAFRDVSIHTVVRVIENVPGADGWQWMGLLARGTEDEQNFYFGGISSIGYVSVGKWSPYAFDAELTALDPRQMDIDLQLDVVGSTLSMWAWSDAGGIPKPAAPQATFTDATLARGYVGFGYNPRGGSGELIVRSFEVVPEPATGGLVLVGACACCLFYGPRIARRVATCTACECLVGCERSDS
jgi:hypothetical protein